MLEERYLVVSGAASLLARNYLGQVYHFFPVRQAPPLDIVEQLALLVPLGLRFGGGHYHPGPTEGRLVDLPTDGRVVKLPPHPDP